MLEQAGAPDLPNIKTVVCALIDNAKADLISDVAAPAIKVTMNQR